MLGAWMLGWGVDVMEELIVVYELIFLVNTINNHGLDCAV